MAEISWHEAFEIVRPHVVRVSTPQASGTGFLVSYSSMLSSCGIATAGHVINEAHNWEQPIKIEHFSSGKSLVLRHDQRAIIVEEEMDTAAIIFDQGDMPLPPDPLGLIQETKSLRVGVEVGWLGFPAVSPQNLCFFSGSISAHIPKEYAYLVDGVAINGVSGGPTFCQLEDSVGIVGVVSAYIANRVTGETLPGLSVVRDVSQFQILIKTFKSLEEAKAREANAKKSIATGKILDAKNKPV